MSNAVQISFSEPLADQQRKLEIRTRRRISDLAMAFHKASEIESWPKRRLMLAGNRAKGMFFKACRPNLFHKVTQQLILEASMDGLTKMLNRTGFDQALDKVIDVLNKPKKGKRQTDAEDQLSNAHLIFIDLDKFKPINDTFGHIAGDKTLKAVAELLKEIVRDTDIVARVGGDEFVVVLNNASLAIVQTKMQEIQDGIDSIVLKGTDKQGEEQKFGLGASLGLTEIDPSISAEANYKIADLKMQDKKEAKQKASGEIARGGEVKRIEGPMGNREP